MGSPHPTSPGCIFSPWTFFLELETESHKYQNNCGPASRTSLSLMSPVAPTYAPSTSLLPPSENTNVGLIVLGAVAGAITIARYLLHSIAYRRSRKLLLTPLSLTAATTYLVGPPDHQQPVVQQAVQQAGQPVQHSPLTAQTLIERYYDLNLIYSFLTSRPSAIEKMMAYNIIKFNSSLVPWRHPSVRTALSDADTTIKAMGRNHVSFFTTRDFVGPGSMSVRLTLDFLLHPVGIGASHATVQHIPLISRSEATGCLPYIPWYSPYT